MAATAILPTVPAALPIDLEYRDPNQTDDQWIAELRRLNPVLWFYAGGSTAQPPFPIYHPLMHWPHGAGSYSPEYLNQQFKTGAETASRLLADKDYLGYLVWHAKGYRVTLFESIADRLTDQEYWSTLSWAWTNSENIFQNRQQWRRLLNSKRPLREHFMTEKERAVFAALPPEFIVYRGFKDKDAVGRLMRLKTNNRRGMSWTLSKEKAEWFASMSYKDDPRKKKMIKNVRQLTVRKSECIGYKNDRQEQEIVLRRIR